MLNCRHLSCAGTTSQYVCTDYSNCNWPAWTKNKTNLGTPCFLSWFRIATWLKKRVMRDSSVVILQASQINLLYYMYMYTEFKIIISLFLWDQLQWQWSCWHAVEYLQLVITLMTLNFLRTGQVLEAPAGTSSKSISNTIQKPLATKVWSEFE